MITGFKQVDNGKDELHFWCLSSFVQKLLSNPKTSHKMLSNLRIWTFTAESVQWLRYGLDDRCSILGRDTGFCSLSPLSDRFWGPRNSYPMGTGALSRW